MALDPLSGLLTIGSQLIDRLWPDPTKANEAKLELLKLQTSGELAQIAGQLEVNKAEASNSSLFVAGWRPFIGWCCGGAMAYQYLFRPLASAGYVAYTGHAFPIALPGLDDNLWQLLVGMLGLGGLRSFEKAKGVA